MHAQSFSPVRLFATPWTREPATLLYPWDFPSKNTEVGCHALLQGIFLTQGKVEPIITRESWKSERFKESWIQGIIHR